uniref:Uncharacterized protein n=1 Tax=Anguilla anguilla TaxID=7936 RepID=A0A0E9Q7W5_ANGAN
MPLVRHIFYMRIASLYWLRNCNFGLQGSMCRLLAKFTFLFHWLVWS